MLSITSNRIYSPAHILRPRRIALAVASASAMLALTANAHAAGLDRSTQPSWGIAQDGTYAYAEHVTIAPKVSGKDNLGRKTGNMTEDYKFTSYGVKADVNDSLSFGVFFDEPWGADVQYSGDNSFVGAPNAVINGLYAQASKNLQAAGINANITSAANLQNTIAGLQNQVTAGENQLTAASSQLTQAQSQLDAAKTQLTQAQAALAANPNLASALNPKIAALEQGIATGTAKLDAGKAQFEAGQKQVAAGKGAIKTLSGLQAATTPLSQNTEGTKVKVSSKKLTGVFGVKFGENKNWQVYAGPSFQKLEGEAHLRGDSYKTATNYDAMIPTSSAVGWLAGVAYSKPEIALKASLTYRSEIDHDLNIGENLPLYALRGGNPRQTNQVTVTTPQSVNLDFQTGLNKTTLLTGKVRWVPWGDFAIKPKLYGDVSGLNLVDYNKDSWAVDIGVGKKVSDRWAVSAQVTWDSGAGDPVTSLGPVDGYWGLGLGVRYNITPEWSASLGAKYLMFGDVKARLPDNTIVGKFEDNHATVYGLRLTYQKK